MYNGNQTIKNTKNNLPELVKSEAKGTPTNINNVRRLCKHFGLSVPSI